MTDEYTVEPGKREQILDAAQKSLADKGFHSTTIDMIAEGAGVGKGTVYLYFNSKAEILATLLEQRITELADGVERAVTRRRTVEGKLRAVVEAHFDFYVRHQAFIRILFSHFRELPEDMVARIDRSHETFHHFLYGMLQQGIDTGALRPASARLLTHGLLGIIHSTALEWAVGHENSTLETLVEGVCNLFFHGAAEDSRNESSG